MPPRHVRGQPFLHLFLRHARVDIPSRQQLATACQIAKLSDSSGARPVALPADSREELHLPRKINTLPSRKKAPKHANAAANPPKNAQSTGLPHKASRQSPARKRAKNNSKPR